MTECGTGFNADSEGLYKDYGFRPEIGIREELGKFAELYKDYYFQKG